MTRPFNVLFICTHNSARSIMAEAVMNQLGQGRFRAYSAGSLPRGEVHPLTLSTLAEQGYPTAGLSSKPWEVFAKPGAPPLDFIITVCDNAAGEVCPVWPGQPMTAHWGVPDPAAVQGSEAEIAAAFSETARMLGNRIRIFLSLPLASIDRMSLQTKLREIGQTVDEPQSAQ